MSEPVAELTLALLGDPASFERMMAAAEARLDKFVASVDAKGQALQASLDRTLGAVSSGAGRLDAALQPVVTALGDVGSAASVAGSEVKAASGELRAVAGDAGAAAGSLKKVGESAAGMGKAVTSGMDQAAAGTSRAEKALSGFAGMVARTRAAADKPIVQRVSVERTGGAGGRSGGAGGGGREALTSAGYGLMTAGGAILGAEAAMIKSGEGTEDALRRLYATAGETQNYEDLRREVLGIATTFGLMPEEVAKALYPIESLGYKGAAGLKVLTAAANMAKGTQADLGLTSELVAKTLNLYGLDADHAAHLTDVFTVAIKDAVVPGKDFVPAYSGLMTIAKNAGLSVEETASALAVMTHNAKSASVGGTQLRAFIAGIITPTKAMRDAAKEAGLGWLASGEGAAEFKRVGLAGVLDEIHAATNGNVTALGKLLPDMRKNQAAMALLNNGGMVFTRTLKDVQSAQGATSKASQEMDKSLAQSGRNMDAALGAASSNLETAMKPVLLRIYTVATDLVNAFNRLSPASQAAIGKVAAVTGAVLLLGGAGLVVTRWVTGVRDLFGSFAERGVAANAAVTASAETAAAAEGSIGAAAEVSAADMEVVKLGMLAADEELAAGAGTVATAEAGVGTAATAAGAAGVLAFGPAGLLMAALLGLGVELYNLKNRWDDMRDATDQAADAARRYADAKNQLAATGEQGALMAAKSSVAQEISDLDEALDVRKTDPFGILNTPQTELRGKGYDVDHQTLNGKPNPYYTDDGIRTRLKALEADQPKIAARLHEIEMLGGGQADAARSGLGQGGEVPGYEKTMLGMVGEHVGYQCGEAITKALNANGIPQTVSQLRDMARKDPSLRVKPNADGTYPNGTIFFFPKGGGSKEQHFGVGYQDQQGRQRVTENTTAGGGGYKYRADRLYSDILAQHGGRVEAFRPPSVSLGDGPPPPGGAEPDWAKRHGDKPKKAAAPSAGSLADISLKRLDDVLPTGDLNGTATDAANYEEKLRRLDDALADHDAKVRASGAGYDGYALKIAAMAQKLALADNAFRNTGRAIETLSPEVSRDEAAVRLSRAAVNGLSDRMKSQKQAGLPKSDPAVWAAEVRQHEALRAQYNADLAAYQRDEAALKENRRVHSQASENKDRALGEMDAARAEQEQKATERFLKAQQLAVKLGPDGGGISRDAYDQSLQDALAGKNKSVGKINPQGDDYARIQDALLQSQIARQNAGAKIGRETLQLQKKDFDALQQDLDGEVQAYRDAGVSEADILTFRNLKQHEIDLARTAQARKDLVDGGKEMLDLGLETATDYQNQLGRAILSLQADWAKAETDGERQGLALQIAKLRLEIGKIDWDAAAKQAEVWKQAVDTGGLSTEEYILRLKDLQAQIPATAQEYKSLTSEIAAANKAMYDKAEQQAGAAASKATDQLMAVLQKAKTLKAAIQDSLKDAATDALHKTIEDALKKQVLKIVLASQSDKMKKAAEAHQKAADALAKLSEGDKMKAAAAVHAQASDLFGRSVAFMGNTVTTMGQGITTMGQGIASFGSYVAQFVSAASPGGAAGGTGPADGSSGGGFGQGSSGGGFGQGAPSQGGGFGQGALPAATGALAGDQSGGAGGAALGALNGSGNGGAAGQIGASILPALQQGNDGQAAESGAVQAAGMGLLGNTAASIAPWIGVALAALSLFGPHKHTPTSTQSQQYAGVLTSFSPTINSGYSGADGLRTLLGPVSRAQAGVGSQGQAQGHTLNITIAPGAFQGIADPQGHANVMLQKVSDGLSRMAALDNASRGEG